jgi:hypothetical protein
MICAQCGGANPDQAAACMACGNTFLAIPQVRPWVRYWARMMDLYLTCIVAGVLMEVVFPGALDKVHDQVIGIAAIFAWVFVESLCLATIGTTPGKWVMNTRLIGPGGTKPTYITALSRSFKVWWRGLGMGVPLAYFITLLVSHSRLTENGTTTWDRDTGFRVVHERIGILRASIAILFFLGMLALLVVGSTEA